MAELSLYMGQKKTASRNLPLSLDPYKHTKYKKALRLIFNTILIIQLTKARITDSTKIIEILLNSQITQ